MPIDRATPDVSVIIASVEAADSIEACIASVKAAAADRVCEVVVVDASRDRSAALAEAVLGTHAVLRRAPGTLAPALWADGIGRSTGRIVVLTTAHFSLSPTSIARLSDALDQGLAGASGSMALSEHTTPTDWAVFYLRYSEFLREPERMERDVSSIPADNAAYDGHAIRRFMATAGSSFWEVEFHRALRTAGRSLAVVAGAAARYGRSFPFSTIAVHRFRHGRHAGAWRVAIGERSPVAVVITAPAVPLVLAARVYRRIGDLPEHRRRFVRSLPRFLALAVCWAAGEALGAMSGSRQAAHRTPAHA